MLHWSWALLTVVTRSIRSLILVWALHLFSFLMVYLENFLSTIVHCSLVIESCAWSLRIEVLTITIALSRMMFFDELPIGGLACDDTKQMYYFIGTPSAECCSKRIFPTRVTRSVISNSWGTLKNSLHSRQATCKRSSLSCVPRSTWILFCRLADENKESFFDCSSRVRYKPRVPSWGKFTLATTLCTWSPNEVAHCLVSSVSLANFWFRI
jgi:hypothetical protein